MPIKPLALTFGEARRSPVVAEEARPRVEQVWIGVHWPAFALQAVEAGDVAAADIAKGVVGADDVAAPQAVRRSPLREDRRPTVVVEASGGRLKVVALNGAARARGIRVGLDLNAAFAFSGALRVLERSFRAERSLLEALAAIGHRFTPSVSLEPPDGLLLEVQASLALFGGIERLRFMLCEALGVLASGFHIAVAPTPLAALWLARGGEEAATGGQEVTGGEGVAGRRAESMGGGETLASRLGRLPLAVTRWPDAVLDLLEGIGVATIGDCLRLPRDGFARRVGKAYLEALDRSIGRRADPRAAFDAPKHLDFEVELVDESTSLPVFVDAVTRMTQHLGRELKMRQAQIGKLQLVFEHRRIEPTVHRLELLESTGNELRLLELLRDKLERIVLPAPATVLRLSTGPIEPAAAETGRLFKGEGRAGAGGARCDARVRLVERLRGRLGESAVHGLVPAADHRPERAWAAAEVPGILLRGNDPRPRSRRRASGTRVVSHAGDPGMPDRVGEQSMSDRAGNPRMADRVGEPSGARPLWLSAAPEPLRCVDGRPHLGGRLRMLEGPERIESGWWDGEDVGRDYFVAVAPDGERLWVFRDRADGRWYLHGRFG